MLTKLLREPLVHFSFVGLLLFVAYALLNPSAPDNMIVVSDGRIEQLQSRFFSVWQRDPTEEELADLIRNYVVDEAYALEARALGLDKDDAVVRRRLRQKMEFMLQDVAALEAPTEQDLQDFYDANADRYRLPTRYSFQQVYLSADRPREELDQLLEQATQAMEQQQRPTGDNSLLPSVLSAATATSVERQFGEQLLLALNSAPIGQWFGPVRSGFGSHFVLLEQRLTGRLPSLSDIRSTVVDDWRYQRNKEVSANYEASLLDGYEVKVEGYSGPLSW